MAEDVERWLAGEPVRAWSEPWPNRVQRWLRRHRTLAASGTAAASSPPSAWAWPQQYLLKANEQLTDAYDRARKAKEAATEQRDKARANFQLARDAVERLLTRVSEDRLLNTPQMEKLRREIMLDALQFHERFLHVDSSDPAVRHEAAEAYWHRARHHRLLGHNDQAEQAFQRAMWKQLIMGPR